jgi:hypothetical protein
MIHVVTIMASIISSFSHSIHVPPPRVARKELRLLVGGGLGTRSGVPSCSATAGRHIILYTFEAGSFEHSTRFDSLLVDFFTKFKRKVNA